MTPEPPPLQRLLHLVDRAERGALLPAEAAQLRTSLQARDAALAACTAQLVHDQAALARVRSAVRVADDEDVTDWQRGYRACSERSLAALEPPAHDGGPSVADCREADARWWNGEKGGE